MLETTCTFCIGNNQLARFSSDLPLKLKAEGRDVQVDLTGMLLQSLLQHRVQITDEFRDDIKILVEKYLEKVLNPTP